MTQPSRLMILGASGMLGREVVELAADAERTFLALGRPQLDIRDENELLKRIDGFAPEVLVNCAAYTDVDGCEERTDLAFEINAEAPTRIAQLCRAESVHMIHVSTDYVFAGAGTEPYTEDQPTAPQGVYGASKLAGEEAVIREGGTAVRTSWLFGPYGPSFVSAIAKRALAGHDLRVVHDQVGCPTYARFLARALLELADHPPRGVLHYCNSPAVSWYEFARAIVDIRGLDVLVEPVSTEEFPRPAPRPAYSVLSVDAYEKRSGRKVESWRDGLESYFERVSDDALTQL